MQAISLIVNKLLGRPAKKRVVYTCMFGYSEAFMDRQYHRDEDTDYICFTDDKTLTSDFWKFIYVNSEALGPQKTSKLIKICPHLYLSTYKCSLYVDNTVRINAPVSDIFMHLSKEQIFVTYKHSSRSCAYIESDAVIRMKYADPQVLSAQIKEYREDGMPENVGLYHAAVLLPNHNDKQVKKISRKWYREIEKYSYRDQVALSYVVWKHSFRLSLFDGFSTDDKLVFWPEFIGHRVPRGFRDDVYLRVNPDVALQSMPPREHYLKIGADNGLAWEE